MDEVTAHTHEGMSEYQESLLAVELVRGECIAEYVPSKRLNRAVRAVRSVAALAHATMEYHSTPRRTIFPDPDVPQTGALFCVPGLSGVWLRVETDVSVTGGHRQLAHTALFAHDDADEDDQHQLYQVCSRQLGYGDGHLTHPNMIALKAHVRKLCRALSQVQETGKIDLKPFYSPPSSKRS